MNNTQDEKVNNNDELVSKIEKQIAVTQWIQATGVFAEAILLTKLYAIKENSNTTGEQKILAGIWVQTIGQLVEAASVTKQLDAADELILYKAQRLAIAGDLGQSIGAALQAIGGEEILLADGIGNIFESIIP